MLKNRKLGISATLGLAIVGSSLLPATAAYAQDADCVGTPWDTGAVYTGGDAVSYDNTEYEAKWWTTGETPGTTGQWGVWKELGSCSGDTTDPVEPDPDPTDPVEPDPDPTDPTDPAPSGDQYVVGYWENWNAGGKGMKLSEVPEEYNLIHVAFAFEDASNPGGIYFNVDSSLNAQSGYTNAEFIQDVADLKAQGRQVVISIGGQNHTVSIDSDAKAQNLANSTVALMDEFGFAGIDIDLEHGINATYMEKALRSIEAQTGGDFLYTMAPQTADLANSSKEYYKLATATQDILTLVHMQYYNSGTQYGCDGKIYAQGTIDFLTALACIQVEKMGLDPSQIALGLPATTSAAGGGYVNPSVVADAVDCLQTGNSCGSWSPETPYGDIGGAMTWSINWDKVGGYNWSSTVAGAFN